MAMVYDRNDPTYIYIYMVERRLVIIIVSTSVRHGRRDVDRHGLSIILTPRHYARSHRDIFTAADTGTLDVGNANSLITVISTIPKHKSFLPRGSCNHEIEKPRLLLRVLEFVSYE